MGQRVCTYDMVDRGPGNARSSTDDLEGSEKARVCANLEKALYYIFEHPGRGTHGWIVDLPSPTLGVSRRFRASG